MKVTDREHARWRERALTVVELLCYRQTVFHSDDVWDALVGFPARPRDQRALGGVLRQAAAEKLCRPAGRVRRVNRLHGAFCVVWESLVYQPRRKAA